MNATMGIEACKAYLPLQDAESKLMLRDLLEHDSEGEKAAMEPFEFIRRYVPLVVNLRS